MAGPVSGGSGSDPQGNRLEIERWWTDAECTMKRAGKTRRHHNRHSSRRLGDQDDRGLSSCGGDDFRTRVFAAVVARRDSQSRRSCGFMAVTAGRRLCRSRMAQGAPVVRRGHGEHQQQCCRCHDARKRSHELSIVSQCDSDARCCWPQDLSCCRPFRPARLERVEAIPTSPGGEVCSRMVSHSSGCRLAAGS
jgi:hypothetical protein